MGCLTLNGLVKACGGSIGGIKTVKLIEYAGVTSFTESDGLVSDIVYTVDYSGASYAFLKESSSFNEPSVGDGITASIHFEPVLSLVFRQMSSTGRTEITQMTQGDLIAFIQDSNLKWWMVGSDRGLQLAAGAGATTGTVMSDMNGYTLTINGMETYMAYEVDTTAMASFPE